jgi:hypothetical protein
VTYFKDVAPDQFGNFGRAFLSMFRISAGETWVDSLPDRDEYGELNVGAAMYVCSYVVLVVWVLLQVFFGRAELY